MGRRHSEGLLFTEDLPPGLLWAEYLLNVFIGPKNFSKSSIDRIFLPRASVNRRPSLELLWNEDLLKTFHGPKTIYRFFIDRRTFPGPLNTEDLFQVFYGSKTHGAETFSRSFMGRRFFMGRIPSQGSITFSRSSMDKMPSHGLSWIEDLLQVFMNRRSFQSRLEAKGPNKTLYGPKTFSRSPMDTRRSPILLWF